MLRSLKLPWQLRSTPLLCHRHRYRAMTSVNGTKTSTWQAIVHKKRQDAYQKIPEAWRLPTSYTDRVTENTVWNVLDVPRECGILSPSEIEITEKFDAVALVGAIASGQVTSEQVTIAFCKRAAIAQQLTRCLTETMFDEAIARARRLDEEFKSSGRLKGPFHGLPISVKDSFSVKGAQTTLAYVSFVGNALPSQNSPLVDMLLDLGAVPYVKTNLPQTQMSADSDNNLFGRVLNPRNLSWGAGGSSGGEGALVAMRGSILGVGTDIAGSIRIPSLSCGTFGFRPSSGRVPYPNQGSGDRNGHPGFLPVAGPLATTARDLKFFMETIIGARPWKYDPFSHAVPWHKITKRADSLRLGYISKGDPDYPLHPPIIRALGSAAKKLQQAGHTIVPLENIPSISKAVVNAFKYFSLDPQDTAMGHVLASGEPVIKSLKLSNMDFSDKEFNVSDLFTMNAERNKFIADWWRIWRENDLDGIIMPGHRKTAGPHDTYGYPPYTLIWNLADRPACIIPYEKADATKDSAIDGLTDYDPQAVDGATCAIQIVGQTFEDEELLSVVEVVAAVLAE